jgi:hypothetical protein
MQNITITCFAKETEREREKKTRIKKNEREQLFSV